MKINKALQTGSTTLLLLKLLEAKDMYGYEMIEQLANQSQNVFELKAGTLYPLLHSLHKKGFVKSYDSKTEKGRVRKYYKITKDGLAHLVEKELEWSKYTSAVNRVLRGGVTYELQSGY